MENETTVPTFVSLSDRTICHIQIVSFSFPLPLHIPYALFTPSLPLSPLILIPCFLLSLPTNPRALFSFFEKDKPCPFGMISCARFSSRKGWAETLLVLESGAAAQVER